jgi:hypothetical protein
VIPRRTVDPRIRARRVAVTREQGRRRLRLLLLSVSFVTVVGLAWLAVQSAALDVDSITVEGTRRVPTAEVIGASGVEHGDALVFVDTGAARAAVEALPRIASARVRRAFPGTLAIEVTERDPVAWTTVTAEDGQADERATGGERGESAPVVLMDARGRVIEEAPVAPPGLVEVHGLGSLPAVGRAVRPAGAVTLLAALPEALRARVAAVTVDHGEATLTLAERDDGTPTAQEVRLGEMRDVRAKAVAALAVLDALDGDVGYLDVRVPSAPATGG